MVAAAGARRPSRPRGRSRLPTDCSTATASSPAGSGRGRAVAGRLLVRLPGAARRRGVRPGPPRLLRGGARGGAVRTARAPSIGCAPQSAPAIAATRRPDAGPRGDRSGQPVRRRPAVADAPPRRRPPPSRASARSQGRRAGRPGRRRVACSTSSEAAGRCCRSPTSADLQPAADALALAVHDGALGKLASRTSRRRTRPASALGSTPSRRPASGRRRAACGCA